MTSEQLRHQLAQQYELICFEDLNTVAQSHGHVYSMLRSYWRSEFAPNQRLIFYSCHEPSQKLLDHLQHGLSRIDISNWFVTICGPWDISSKLQQANRDFGFDDRAIGWLSADLDHSEPLNDHAVYDHHVLCPVPFSNLFETTDQRIQPCCKYNGVIGDTATENYKEIFYGPVMAQIREDMRIGIQHAGCSTCWKNEQQGTMSQRQIDLLNYQDSMNQSWVDDPKIRIYSGCPTTVCNFKCRICGSYASSAWAAEDLQFASNDNHKQQLILTTANLNNWQGANQFVNKIQPMLANLEWLHILGGEPLYIKDFDRVLEALIDQQVNQHCSIVINTNGSVYKQNIVDLLKQFKFTEILLSIDDIGERFEIQRGGNWSKVYQNLVAYAGQLTSQFSVKINPTVNIQNVLYLDQLAALAKSLNLEMNWIYLDHPYCFNLDAMTKTASDMVWQKYKNSEYSELRKIANRAKHNQGTDGQEFIAEIDRIDQRRTQSFKLTHKEIYNAMLVCS